MGGERHHAATCHAGLLSVVHLSLITVSVDILNVKQYSFTSNFEMQSISKNVEFQRM
jgi:hypothetical protein